MNKESWHANKFSDMDAVTISESDDWIVDYDRSRGMYRVSYFQDNHFVDEHWFDAFEDKEVDDRIEKIIEKLEDNKVNFKHGLSRGRMKFSLSANGMEYYLNLLIDWIKNLK